jgi:hypothetical protein
VTDLPGAGSGRRPAAVGRPATPESRAVQEPPTDSVVVGPLALVAVVLLAVSVRRRSLALGAAAGVAATLELRSSAYRRYVRDPRRADVRLVTVARG